MDDLDVHPRRDRLPVPVSKTRLNWVSASSRRSSTSVSLSSSASSVSVAFASLSVSVPSSFASPVESLVSPSSKQPARERPSAVASPTLYRRRESSKSATPVTEVRSIISPPASNHRTPEDVASSSSVRYACGLTPWNGCAETIPFPSRTESIYRCARHTARTNVSRGYDRARYTPRGRTRE